MFFSGSSGILNSNWHLWQRKVEAMLRMLNTHARLQISLLTRFLSLLHWASQCAFGNGRCQLLVRQFFSLFAQFKTTTKSYENDVLYQFSNTAISPQINEKNVFYTGKLYGLTGMRDTHDEEDCPQHSRLGLDVHVQREGHAKVVSIREDLLGQT